MPLTGNPEHDIPVERAAGKPEKQAVAIALSKEREMKGKDAGIFAGEYQDQGHVVGFGTKQLSAANAKLTAARKATPEHLRDMFRGGIRHDKQGYNWNWVLRDTRALDVEPVPVNTKYAERPKPAAFKGNSLVMTAEQAKTAYAPKGPGPGRLHDAIVDEWTWTCPKCNQEFYGRSSNSLEDRAWHHLELKHDDVTTTVKVKEPERSKDVSPVGDDYEEEGWDPIHSRPRPVQEHEDVRDAEVKPVRVNPAPMAKTVPVSKAKHVKDNITGEQAVISKVQSELQMAGLPWNPATKTVVEEACRNGMTAMEIVSELRKFHRGHAEDDLNRKEKATLLRVIRTT